MVGVVFSRVRGNDETGYMYLTSLEMCRNAIYSHLGVSQGGLHTIANKQSSLREIGSTGSS